MSPGAIDRPAPARGGRVARAMILVLAAVTAPAVADEPPLPDERLGVRTAPLLLLSRPDVRADLGLDAMQAASADQMITKLYLQAAGLKGKTELEARAARRAIDAMQLEWLERELSEDQRSRLAQIDLQWEGPSALISRPTIARSLRLSADQRTRLQKAVERRNRLRARGKTSTYERQLAETSLAILTPDQRERWKAMLGRAFVPQTVIVRANDKTDPPGSIRQTKATPEPRR